MCQATPYAAAAAEEAGWLAARAERIKRMRVMKDVPDHAASWFVPCLRSGRAGTWAKEAELFVTSLLRSQLWSGRIPEGVFVRWPVQVLSDLFLLLLLLLLVTVQPGNAEMCRRSGLVISRESNLRYDAGFVVLVGVWCHGVNCKCKRCSVAVGKSAHPDGCITSSEDRVISVLECAASLITAAWIEGIQTVCWCCTY